VMAAALITFPLSLIPFAPLAPGFAVVLFGLVTALRILPFHAAVMALAYAAALVLHVGFSVITTRR